MPALAFSSTCALTAPLTYLQKPFTLLVGFNDLTRYVDKDSYRLSDPGFGSPATFSFDIIDPKMTVTNGLATEQWVFWINHLNGSDRYLFGGFVKNLLSTKVANYLVTTVTCVDFSDALDNARPLILGPGKQRGTSDLDSIESAMGQYLYGMPWMACESSPGGGSNIATLATIGYIDPAHTTLRNAIEQFLAATGLTRAVYYVDALGYLHTQSGLSGAGAPYKILDVAADRSLSIPAMNLAVEYDAINDADATYVAAATAAASTLVMIGAPHDPFRETLTDAGTVTTLAAATNAGTIELGNRQNIKRLTMTIVGYDGWAKGQQITVTDQVFGFVNQAFVINAVDMTVLSGTGIRQYTITAGYSPNLMRNWIRRGLAAQFEQVSGQSIGGSIGGHTVN